MALNPMLSHILDTYRSETAKTNSVWRRFENSELGFTPHERSTPVLGIFKHQLLSERRFFAEFLNLEEPPPDQVVPAESTVEAYAGRLVDLAAVRVPQLAAKPDGWWLEQVEFFDVSRQRIWIVWRRILHSAHHRTQLTVYLRLLNKAVPSTYGPTYDETWDGADPTATVEAAGRK